MTEYIFFMGYRSPFSNFYRTRFSIDDIYFHSSEQYFMYQKALCCRRQDIATKILQASTPNECKRLTSKSKMLMSSADIRRWEQFKKQVMLDALYAKFTQNEFLKNTLLETNGKILVETGVGARGSRDTCWGIGLRESEAMMTPVSQWGRNLLGECLMEVRDWIMYL